MSILTTKTARTMMYLGSIGGLLVVNGFVVIVLWNNVLRNSMNTHHELSFLEGIGITAFAYVLVFAIRYGRTSGFSAASVTGKKNANASRRCAEMSPEQRAALRDELVQSCGCKETVAK